MADVLQLQLEVATPERLVIHEVVTEVQIPTVDGYVGILPAHAPMLAQVGTGFLSYLAGGRKRFVAVSGGFLEVANNRVRVLADTAERADEIDVKRARAALQRAQERLAQPNPGLNVSRAVAALNRATARLSAAGQL